MLNLSHSEPPYVMFQLYKPWKMFFPVGRAKQSGVLPNALLYINTNAKTFNKKKGNRV